MIAGNPKTGRTMLTLAIVLVFVMLPSALLIASRKRTSPQQEPPLVLRVHWSAGVDAGA